MFRLRTLGGAFIESATPNATRSSGRRRLAVLALLALARDRGLSRDKLLGYLWPERDEERARHALSQILYSLRGELGDDAIVASGETLRLNPAVLSSDVADFEDAVARRDHPLAASLYGGPFLDGFFLPDAPEFEHWVEEQRQRLARACAAALEAAAQAAAEVDRMAARDYWRRLAAFEPLNARVALRLMQALVDAGDVEGALRHARVHATLRAQELQAAPDPAVEALAERLRRAPPPVRVTPAPHTTPPATSPESPAALPATSPSSAAEDLPAALASVHAAPWKRLRPFMRASVAGALLVASVLLVAGVVFARRAHKPETPISIVVGSVRSPDSVLGLAVREALRAELEAEAEMHVVGQSQVMETLQLMRVPEPRAIDAPLAVEIAQRRGVPLAIVASATPLGSGVQIVVDLIDAGTEGTIATISERPENPDDVIAAVSRLSRELRRRVAGTRVTDAPKPLPAVTTSSLAALRDYALARQATQRLDRQGAIVLLEAALAHDSLFALAHYLLGDLLWYVDQQRHSEAHLNTALRLSDRLPPRERLIVRARHEQLVRDRPDSALAYWQQLRASYPDEPLAYEGMIWAYLAMERNAELAVTTAEARAIDPLSRFFARMRYVALLYQGDTSKALATARETSALVPDAELDVLVRSAERARDWNRALRILDSALPPLGGGRPNPRTAPQRQLLLLALGRTEEARREMDAVVEGRSAQFPHRALLFQAHAESWHGAPTDSVRRLLRRAVSLVADADIYPPAVARLTELAVTAAARIGDTAMINAARQLIEERDDRRGLRSYTIVQVTIAAARAFVRGDMRAAAALARRSRVEPFHGRAVADVMLLEADARDALGEHETARTLREAARQRELPWAAYPGR